MPENKTAPAATGAAVVEAKQHRNNTGLDAVAQPLDSEDFSWHRHADDIVVREQLQIAVYTSARGDVVIRQSGADPFEEDDMVVCTASNAPALAQAILRAAGIEGEAPAVDRAAPKDPGAAERMRRHRERNAHRNGEHHAERNGAPLLLEGRA